MSEVVPALGQTRAFDREALAVVLDLHVHGAVMVLDADLGPAGFGMAGDIGERLLGHAVEDGAPRVVHLLHSGKGREAHADAGSLHEPLHVGLEGGNEPEVVQHGRAEVAGEAVDDLDGFGHQLLRVGDFIVKIAGVGRGLDAQGGEPEIDAGEGLGDDVVQFPADLFALLFLGGEETAGQVPQFLLHVAGFFPQLKGGLFAGAEGFLHGLAADDFVVEFLVGCGQFDRAAGQGRDHVLQLHVGLAGAAVGFLDGGHGLGKERAGPADHSIPRSGGDFGW